MGSDRFDRNVGNDYHISLHSSLEVRCSVDHLAFIDFLNLSLLMSYIYGAPCKAVGPVAQSV
jgi:hypothetical protein